VIDCPLTYTDVDLDVIYNEIYTEPEDATLDPDNGYAIVDSVDGISFDLEGAKALLAAAADGETVTIPLVFTEAEITTSELEDSLFRDVLGSFQTNVGGSAARKSNVQLAAEKCDEYIMLPGDIFGFNETVGERTAANGFSAAPAYVNGDTVDEIGGGICQVSSTIYNACLLANLEITERSNHSYTSSYVDVGFDATVSWGGPDYKFCNDTDYPIKLVMVYENSTLTAKIYGTKVDDITVKMSSEILSVDNYETKYEDDDTMEAGKQTTSVVGETGYKVQTYRSLYDGNGNLISTTEESYSNYKRRDKVVLVGTKGSTTTEASTDTEETEEATTEAATEATTEAPATTEAATTEAPAAETPTE
jgi:vancomycin resistance protein YoaR